MKVATGKSASSASRARGGVPFNKVSEPSADGRKRILIVDDSLVFRKTTAFKLKKFGYETLVAEDGPAAIQQIRSRPDLILLDLNFPPDVAHGGGVPWDGPLILSWLRRMHDAQHIPVIVVTGADWDEYSERCEDAKVVDVFVKPIDHAALVSAIRKALNEEVAPPKEQTDSPKPKAERPAELGKNRSGPAQPQPEPAAAAEVIGTNPTRKRILLVDDESDWRYMGALYLTECGHEVFTAANTQETLQQAAAVKPDLVVLDLKLADESGEALMKLLATVHPELPVLIYTGRELTDTEAQSLLDQGAAYCLKKGTMDDLITTVGKALLPQVAEPELQSENGPLGGQLLPVNPSEAGVLEGSTLSPNQAVADTNEVPRPEANSPESAVVASSTGSVLIISENEEFSSVARSYLESQSFPVAGIVRDAEFAGPIAAAETEFIIYDLAMTALHVEQFYRALESARPQLCRRVIFITNDRVHPKEDGFVRKIKGLSLWQPFPLSDLLEALQTIRSQ